MRFRLAVFTCSLLLSLASFAGTFSAGGPVSTNNDDTCDIGLYPAATLLLPYFDVDLTNAGGETTLFTITNTSPEERIAAVTLWTDLAYPVITFPIYLTGYDVQSINLYDVIQNGQIAPPRGTGTTVSHTGRFSKRNFELDRSDCASLRGELPEITISKLKQAFVLGRVPAEGSNPQCVTVGTAHSDAHAAGFVTVDVVRTCDTRSPDDAAYWSSVIAYDNVLTGEWIQVNRSLKFAEGNQMVHIRAIPEGEDTATRLALPEIYRSNFPRTFYGRFTGNTRSDGRQPLPSRIASRWILGGPSEFNSVITIWREAQTGAGASCIAYAGNANVPVLELVTFDEAENAVGAVFEEPQFPMPPVSGEMIVIPAQRIEMGGLIPLPDPNAVSGWIYMNLDAPGTTVPLSQAWVVTTMRAEGQASVSFDAIALGNGCTPAAQNSEITGGPAIVGPSGNVNP
jgi:hypothetical protein